MKVGGESDAEIKRRTNFKSEEELLSFIIIVCNGDAKTMANSCSGILTWYEEWFFFFEFCYGRTLIRWIDAASPKNFGTYPKLLIKVFDDKLFFVLRARESWPKYAKLDEDIALRKDKWNERFPNVRLVQWDNTNVPMFQSSNADLQRTTWSNYYNMNCAKGGVSLQLCGWMVTESLWTGGVGDTDYQSKSSIFKK